MGGDNVDTVYFNLESRDLVGRIDGDRERGGWDTRGMHRIRREQDEGKAGDVDSD